MKFMLKILLVLALSFGASTTYAQPYGKTEIFLDQGVSLVKQAQPKVYGPEELKDVHGPAQEVEDVVKFLEVLKEIHPDRVDETVFFSDYAIPENLRWCIEPSLNFAVHSLSSEHSVHKVKRVPGSKTLWYVFLSDYGWSRESWEKVSALDPYFREPWIHYFDVNKMLFYGGNSIVRTDWFLVHAFDTSKQADRGIKTLIYYELLYSKLGIPETIEDFRKTWGVFYPFGEDNPTLNGIPVRPGIIDMAGLSKGGTVSIRHRQLVRVRTATGYHWETYDVNNYIKDRNYFEFLFSKQRDAGEAIGTNFLGLQTYMLFNGQNGKRVEFGDPTVVRNKEDIIDDVRVRNAYSCIHCHAVGINSFVNELDDRRDYVALKARDRQTKHDIENFYLNPDLYSAIKEDQQMYAKVTVRITGKEPIDLTTCFDTLYKWYNQPLPLSQAARECGVNELKFQEQVGNTVSFDLANIIGPDGDIAREIWEDLTINAGTFGHAMLLINKIDKKDLIVDPPKQVAIETYPVGIAKERCPIQTGTTIHYWLNPGDTVNVVGNKDIWTKVEYNNYRGYVQTKFLEIK